MQITIRKSDLLEILQENRDKHHDVFLAAQEGFQQKARRELNHWLGRIKDGDSHSVMIRLDAPRDHTSDYDLAIRMVQLHTGDDIRLAEGDVSCYIRDRWGWSRQWLSNSSSYAADTVAAQYGTGDDSDEWG